MVEGNDDYPDSFDDSCTEQIDQPDVFAGNNLLKQKTSTNKQGAMNKEKSQKTQQAKPKAPTGDDQNWAQKPSHPETQAVIKEESKQPDRPNPLVNSWNEINAANDTNKKIIFKFMRRGFTSLSAEELACTMVDKDFSIDFKKATGEDWTVTYQFKVVERLNRCNFNFKWKTRSSLATSGLGEVGSFFDMCKIGNMAGIVEMLRKHRGHEQQLLEEVDKIYLKTGLHYAVEEDQEQTVKYLLERGAKIDARDKQLRTPIHIACHKGYSFLVRYLVQQKADPFERDFQGKTCLHFAVCSASLNAFPEILTILASESTDLVHMEDHAGRTPLHYAVFNQFSGQQKMIELLLRYGANINALDQDKKTPLHYAAEQGVSTIIPLLIKNGALPGLKDYNQDTPMDVAKTDRIREMMIVYAPQANFNPTDMQMAGLAIEGNQKSIYKITNLHQTNYYEPFEHAKPKKKKKKINQKPAESIDEGVSFTPAPVQTQQPDPRAAPEYDHGLGPAHAWSEQRREKLPYNIRNYQVTLLEYLKRVQEFGVQSYQHHQRPELFSGSWVERVKTLDDLMLQINGERSNVAVMKVFNILFPYEKELPRGRGDELGLAGFWTGQKQDMHGVSGSHPDVLMNNLAEDTKNAVNDAIKNNKVESINDLIDLESKHKLLISAHEMLTVSLQEKDDRIVELTKQLEGLESKGQVSAQAEMQIMQLQERVGSLQDQLLAQREQNGQYKEEIQKLMRDLEGERQNASNAEANAQFQEALVQANKKIEELNEMLLQEKQRNIQLRLKAGQAFMRALDDPASFSASGGKQIDEIFVPEDDNALMRLLAKIEEQGGATLEQKLYKYGDPSHYISQSQYEGMLKQHKTDASDYLPLNRIAGYTFMTTKVKKQKITTLLQRVYDRGQMREKIEKDSMQLISKYFFQRGYQMKKDIYKLFNHFNSDQDEFLSDKEFFEMLEAVKVPRNVQLQRILLAIFDQSKDGKISKKEFVDKLEKYTTFAEVEAEAIESNVINKEQAKELADMLNEENRRKPVFEDFKFSAKDKDHLLDREEETIKLMKEGTLKNEPIKGELKLQIIQITGLREIKTKPILHYKVKQFYFEKQGDQVKKIKRKPMPIFCKKFQRNEDDPTFATINSKMTLPDLFDHPLDFQSRVEIVEYMKFCTICEKYSI